MAKTKLTTPFTQITKRGDVCRVWLKNGDRLTGEVLRFDCDNDLVLEIGPDDAAIDGVVARELVTHYSIVALAPEVHETTIGEVRISVCGQDEIKINNNRVSWDLLCAVEVAMGRLDPEDLDMSVADVVNTLTRSGHRVIITDERVRVGCIGMSVADANAAMDWIDAHTV